MSLANSFKTSEPTTLQVRLLNRWHIPFTDPQLRNVPSFGGLPRLSACLTDLTVCPASATAAPRRPLTRGRITRRWFQKKMRATISLGIYAHALSQNHSQAACRVRRGRQSNILIGLVIIFLEVASLPRLNGSCSSAHHPKGACGHRPKELVGILWKTKNEADPLDGLVLCNHLWPPSKDGKVRRSCVDILALSYYCCLLYHVC